MSNVVSLSHELQQAGQALTDERIEQIIFETDVSNQKVFLGVDNAKDYVAQVCQIFVTSFLNDVRIPLRRKTKILLILNNFALNKNYRNAVMDGIKDMTSVFEEAMKKEGTMPFDSELGRMSEHVLVLLMRVCGYKMKAAQVHEFAEYNTQFAVQLLLAILLKEPAYEFELRCNCLTGLLGFTQPQAFFQANAGAIEFNSCSKFSEKVDFINSLMLRLSALQVIADVLAAPLLEHSNVMPLVHVGVTSTMRFVMNIFQFSSVGTTQWRQHVLLSTTFVDSVVTLYLQAQVRTLQGLLGPGSRMSALPSDLLANVSLSLKFMAFATFHMGRHGRITRPLCTFVPELLELDLVSSGTILGPSSTALIGMYTQLFYLLSNIDALSGDSGLEADLEDEPALQSEALRSTIQSFASRIAAAGGINLVNAFHQKFYSVDTDALVAQDGETFQAIDAVFYAVKEALSNQTLPTPPPQQQAAPSGKHLGDMPSLGKPSAAAQPKQQAMQQPAEIQQAFVAPKRLTALAQNNPYACALNGHTMKVPMLSPYGHNFEKETIEQWLKQQGSVCPITGKPLTMEQLQPNRALQNEIMQQIVASTLTKQSYEDESDLYDF